MNFPNQLPTSSFAFGPAGFSQKNRPAIPQNRSIKGCFWSRFGSALSVHQNPARARRRPSSSAPFPPFRAHFPFLSFAPAGGRLALMPTKFHTGIFIFFLGCLQSHGALVLDESLQGATTGTRSGGAFVAGGWLVTGKND